MPLKHENTKSHKTNYKPNLVEFCVLEILWQKNRVWLSSNQLTNNKI